MGKVKKVETPIVGRLYYDRANGGIVVVENVTKFDVTYRYLILLDKSYHNSLGYIQTWWRKIDVEKYRTW